jgi:hypothetical protein
LAVDGAYNSCQLRCKGLLLLKVYEISPTHGGIVQKRGKLYVRPKIVPEHTGRRVNLSLDLRNTARNDFYNNPTKDSGVFRSPEPQVDARFLWPEKPGLFSCMTVDTDRQPGCRRGGTGRDPD